MYTQKTKTTSVVAAHGVISPSVAFRWKISETESHQCDFRVAVIMYDALYSRRDSLHVLNWMHNRCNLTRGYQYLKCLDAFGIVISRRELAFFYDIYEDDMYPEDVKRWRLQALPDYCLPSQDCTMTDDDYDDVLDAFYEYWAG